MMALEIVVNKHRVKPGKHQANAPKSAKIMKRPRMKARGVFNVNIKLPYPFYK